MQAIADIGGDELGLTAQRRVLPGGFLVERIAVALIRTCPRCQQEVAE